MDIIDRHAKRLAKAELAYNVAIKTVEQERKRLKQAKRITKAVSEAQQLAQEVASTVQQEAHKKIASVVSRCLEAVFGEEAYEFQIKFEKKRGKTEAKLIFVREGKEHNPLRASGGGVVDLASFALRMSCILLARPKSRKFLALDEPLKHLSENYRPAAAKMLEVLSKEFDVQILMVTHAPEFTIGKVIEVE